MTTKDGEEWKARAEKAVAERDAALAACAELRAALERSTNAHQAALYDEDLDRDDERDAQRVIDDTHALLSRPDLGRGWASPEDTAQMVGALQMVESDGEFDSLHEVPRKFVVDVLALLKDEVERLTEVARLLVGECEEQRECPVCGTDTNVELCRPSCYVVKMRKVLDGGKVGG